MSSFLSSLKPNPKAFASDSVAGFYADVTALADILPCIQGASSAILIFRKGGFRDRS